MKRNRNDALFISLSIIFIPLLYILMELVQTGDTINTFKVFTIYAIIGYFWIFYSSRKKINSRCSIYILFMAITIPFYFGTQILVLMGYADKLIQNFFSILDGRIELQYHVIAMKYIIISLQMINLGYLLFPTKNVQKENRDSDYLKEKRNILNLNLNKVATYFLLIVTIPTFALLIYEAILAKSLGHLGYRNSEENFVGIWMIFTYLKGWFLPCCYAKLLVGKKQYRKYILLMISLYCFIYLLSGSRYELIQVLFSLAVIYIYWYRKKINFRVILKYSLVLILLVVVLRSMVYTRDLSGSGISVESISTALSDNLIYESLTETGITYTTVSNIIKNCPTKASYNYGLSYLLSPFLILPNFLRPPFVTEGIFQVSSIFSPMYTLVTDSGYGSSFMAEAYYNLGYFSFVLYIFLGICLKKISNYFAYSKDINNTYIFLICLYIISELVWGIRADLYQIPKKLVYYSLIPLAISYFSSHTRINSLNRRKGNNIQK